MSKYRVVIANEYDELVIGYYKHYVEAIQAYAALKPFLVKGTFGRLENMVTETIIDLD